MSRGYRGDWNVLFVSGLKDEAELKLRSWNWDLISPEGNMVRAESLFDSCCWCCCDNEAVEISTIDGTVVVEEELGSGMQEIYGASGGE